jgi:hypothetical protein
MQLVYPTLGWLFGLLLIGLGVFIALTPPYIFLSGIFLIFAGLAIFPPFRELLAGRAGVTMTAGMTAISVTVLFLGASIFGGMESGRQSVIKAQEEKLAQEKQSEERRNFIIQEFRENRESVIAEVTDLINGGAYRAALGVAEKYLIAADPELKSLQQMATAELQTVKNAKRTQIVLEKLNGIPVESFEQNLRLYRELVSMHPEIENYLAKVNFYTDKLDEKKRQEKAEEERRNRFKAQFSAWDGSHRNLERLIKQTMHNPDSYEHVETTYGDRGGHLLVRTVFRGTNAFGGVVRNSVTAKVSLDGQILSIIE